MVGATGSMSDKRGDLERGVILQKIYKREKMRRGFAVGFYGGSAEDTKKENKTLNLVKENTIGRWYY